MITLLPVCNTYTIIVLVFIALAVLDWMLAIDKITPVLKKICDKTEDETPLPLIALFFIGIISGIIYLSTGHEPFLMFYLAANLISIFIIIMVIVMFVMGAVLYFIIKALERIRNYMLSKKNNNLY